MTRLSDFKGRASKIAVATPGEVKESLAVAKLTQQLGNLPDKVHADCKIYWVHKAADQAIAPFEIGGRAIIPVPVQAQQRAAGHFRWIQDPFICLQSTEGLSLLLPSNADEIGRATVRALALALDCPMRHTDLHLEGGNILQLGDTLLLGKDIAFQNGIPQQGTWLKPDREAWATLERKLKACFQAKHIVWVGTQHQIDIGLDCVAVASQSWQPFFHLDLFVMPGGVSEDGQLRLFIADVYSWEQIGLNEHELAGLARVKLALDEVKNGLLEAISNLQIAPMPLLTTVQSGRLAVETMCNGWIESARDRGQVYLPDFGRNGRKDAYGLHRHAAHLLAEQGMAKWGLKCAWVDMDFEQLSAEGGALHCSTKILERTF
jgi:hypothetical protein